MRLIKPISILTQLALVACLALPATLAGSNGGRDRIKTEDMKEWLTYLASDDLEGRNTYTEGLGLAAGYIAGLLKSWGVKPGGPNGSYFQRVPVQGIKADNKSTVAVEVNGQTRTFKHGEGVSFPMNSGGKQTLAATEIEFLGYGLSAPDAGHDDYAGANVKGKVVVFLGANGPTGLGAQYRRLLGSRARFATALPGAVASIGPPSRFGQGGPPRETQAGAQEQPDFTTVERLDGAVAPAISGQDEFLDFLFSGSEVKYAELKDKAAKGEPLPRFTIKNVKISFNVDTTYRVIKTQYTRNVIGIVEGSDPRLKQTYVAFGAHYDHVGYAEGEVAGNRRQGARGRVTEGAVEDRIWNGADDDGSGTVAIMAMAKAFATGPKPKRSMIFVWHAGEERGLLGSRHFAD
ncbi:MAG TPA: M28 family peptidase, partial [Blastocatellia bacterium]|nr:M28 family peptidase [Blastocatellia bacterium]